MREPFGITTGHVGQPPTPVDRYRLSASGIAVSVLTYGGHLVNVEVPDRNGSIDNVVLGFPDLPTYEDRGHNPYVGAIVGRFANRIAGGRFALDGVAYDVAVNDGLNHLHGGQIGFDRYVWAAEATEDEIVLRHTSPAGDEGYPGRIDVKVSYRVEPNRLTLTYEAVTDAPTIINLTNHAYWNLAGGGCLGGHELKLQSSGFLAVSGSQIPTGDHVAADGPPTVGAGEHDHCYLIDRDGPGVVPAAGLMDAASGRHMTVETDQPGIQVYDGYPGWVCLEAQAFPDAPNHSSFPSAALRPGEIYRQTTMHTFDIR